MGAEELARFAVSYLGASPRPSYDPKMSAAEAASAQPGNTGAAALERWFWRETAAGEKMLVPRVIANVR